MKREEGEKDRAIIEKKCLTIFDYILLDTLLYLKAALETRIKFLCHPYCTTNVRWNRHLQSCDKKFMHGISLFLQNALKNYQALFCRILKLLALFCRILKILKFIFGIYILHCRYSHNVI